MPDIPDAVQPRAQPMADALALLAHWNYSLAAFYTRRWRRQAELPLKLVRSATPSELLEIGRAFEADLLADYADEALHLHHHTRTMMSGVGVEDGADYGGELLRAQQDARTLLDQAKQQAERIVAAAQTRAAEIVAAAEAPPRPAPTRRTASG